MNLEQAYKRLLVDSSFSFLVTKDGEHVSWADYPDKVNLTEAQTKVCTHVVPGSFNPLHSGHKAIYEASHWAPELTFFEISIQRVDKDMVSFEELVERLEQFKGYAPVIVGRAGRFIEKIGTYLEHTKELVFHVGIDTITRMRDDYATTGIQGLNAKFVVHDRIVDGRLKSLKTEFGRRVPFNCVSSPVVRSPENLSISSSKIRSEEKH